MARTEGRSRRPPREWSLARRRPAGRDRWRRRPAAHGDRARALARHLRGAPLARRRRRARGRRGDRSRAPRRVQGVRPLSPARRVGPEHRPDRLRRARARLRRRRPTGGGSRARDRWRSSRTRSPSAGSRRWCGRRSPGASPRWRGCSRARATAGTRWRRGRSSCSRGRRARCSSPASSSRSLPSRRSSSRFPACAAGARATRCRAGLVEVVGIAAACGIATAPILWLQFGVIPLWTVPANALAEPAMPVLLGCGLAASLLAPVVPSAALALSWLAGLAAAWIAFSARLIASLPYAQTSSRPLALGIVAATLGSGRPEGPAALPAPGGRPHGRSRSCRSLALGWWALHRRRAGHHRPGCASPSSTSARATGSCSRRRRGRCSSTPGHRRRTSSGSFAGWACAHWPRS